MQGTDYTLVLGFKFYTISGEEPQLQASWGGAMAECTSAIVPKGEISPFITKTTKYFKMLA